MNKPLIEGYTSNYTLPDRVKFFVQLDYFCHEIIILGLIFFVYTYYPVEAEDLCERIKIE